MEARQPSSIELERRAFRRQQSVRSVLIAAISTIVFAVVVWLTIINTPGWSVVQQSFFDPESWVAAWPRVFEGFLLNLRVLLVHVPDIHELRITICNNVFWCGLGLLLQHGAHPL